MDLDSIKGSGVAAKECGFKRSSDLIAYVRKYAGLPPLRKWGHNFVFTAEDIAKIASHKIDTDNGRCPYCSERIYPEAAPKGE